MDHIEGGAFITARNIFDNEIWLHPAQLRIFLYLCGKAVFKKEGWNIAGVHVPRGSWLASYRKIADGTQWIENNSIKKYGISTVKRVTDELIKQGRITKTETPMCTIWKVENYHKYQSLSNYENASIERGHGTPATSETLNENGIETDAREEARNIPAEHPRNNKKNVYECTSLFEKADGFLKTKEIIYSSLVLQKRMQNWAKLYEEAAISEAFSTAADAWITQGKTGNFLQYLNKILQNDYPKKSENRHEAA